MHLERELALLWAMVMVDLLVAELVMLLVLVMEAMLAVKLEEE